MRVKSFNRARAFAVLVSGGRLLPGAVEKIQGFMRTVHGRRAVHSVIAAEATAGARVRLQPLSGAPCAPVRVVRGKRS